MTKTAMQERMEAAESLASAMLALERARVYLLHLDDPRSTRARELWGEVADLYREVAP